jgi:hypothetical protein
MSDKPLFEGADEYEKTYAPQGLPPTDPDHARVRIEGDTSDEGALASAEPPAAAPVASPGSSPSSVAAPPNIGPDDGVGAPGDPDSQAGYPMDDRDSPDKTR